MTRLALATVLSATIATPSLADGFRQVEDRTQFVSHVSGKALTRLGISLNVTPDGRIEGKAFGKPVTGAWRWKAGLFCRDLKFGGSDLGENCQVVQTNGATMRFISDAGEGDYADLRLR